MTLYFWFLDDKQFNDFIWPYINWYILHFVVLTLEIVGCLQIKKRVATSYIKTYRWLKLNKVNTQLG